MKNLKLKIHSALACSMLVAAPAALVAETDFTKAEAQMRKLAPSVESLAISETPIEGLLQAQINNDIVYISVDGSYLMQGTLFDIDTRTNLTDQAKAVLRKEMVQDLDQSKQISFSPESPDHSVMVFTDIDCGYCRKLHDQIDGYVAQGIEINYLAFPRAGVGSNSFNKFVSVWCADDQQAALTDAKSGTDPLPLQCDNPVQAQYQLGQEIGVTGTPAIVTRSGDLIPGYMPPDALKERLDALRAEDSTAP